MTAEAADELLTVAQIAALAGATEARIAYAILKARRDPVRRVGPVRLFTRADAQAIIEAMNRPIRSRPSPAAAAAV
jgi:hypothetical protein